MLLNIHLIHLCTHPSVIISINQNKRGLTDAFICNALTHISFRVWGKILLHSHRVIVRSHCYMMMTPVAICVTQKYISSHWIVLSRRLFIIVILASTILFLHQLGVLSSVC